MDKKFTAQEAAIAVLKKAEEMLTKAAKMKISSNHDKNAHLYEGDKGTSKLGGTVRSANRNKSWAKDDRSSGPSIERSIAKDKMGEAKTIASKNLENTKAQPKPNLTKADIHEKDQTPADGVQKETIGQHDPAQGKENSNPVWGTEPGCHKLSKFMGRREEKSKAKAAPAQAAPMEKQEKGINVPDKSAKSPGTSVAGQEVRSMNYSKKVGGIGIDAKLGAKAEHGKVLREMKAQPKPNLPKEGK